MCARFSLPLMPLTVAFGNRLQLTEQRNVRQRGSERKRDRKRGRPIKFEPEIEKNQRIYRAQFNWVTNFCSDSL